MSQETLNVNNEIQILNEKINSLENKLNVLLENNKSDSCMRNNFPKEIFASTYEKIKNKILQLKEKLNTLINSKESPPKEEEQVVKV